MINKDVLHSSLVIIVLFAFAFTIYSNRQLREDNRRLSDNIEQIVQERDSKVLEITKKEFKQYYAQQDSLLVELMDSIKLNYRHIERTINHKFNYSFDTTITMVKENDTADNYDLTPRKFRIEKDCVELIATIDWLNNTATTNSDINYNATTAYYWKRKHKFWFIKWGKKQHYAITKNNCTKESKVIDIKFKK